MGQARQMFYVAQDFVCSPTFVIISVGPLGFGIIFVSFVSGW